MWMQAVGKVLPPSYVFEGVRALVAGQPLNFTLLTLGIGLACLQIFLAGWFFARVYRYAVRSGLLARYSAETVS